MSYTPRTDWTKVDRSPAARERLSDRKSRHVEADKKRLADHERPRIWVHAHINSRADFKPGELAEVRQRPHQDYHFRSYVSETRRMYRTR